VPFGKGGGIKKNEKIKVVHVGGGDKIHVLKKKMEKK